MVSPAADSRHSTAIVAHGISDTIDLVLIFPAAPGYFLSEAADVFAWLMKLNNLIEIRFAKTQRGRVLERALATSYPDQCTDCRSRVCTCPPILASTVGR